MTDCAIDKLLATKLCCFDISCDKIELSFDSEVCENSKDKEKIAHLFFDRYLEPNTDDDDFYQPIGADSLNSLCADFVPCVFGAVKDDEQDWLQSQQFCPNQAVYESSDLICLGYEIIDLGMISASIHGISPLSDNRPNLLNKYGLMDLATAMRYLQKNQQSISEHHWRLVGLYVSKTTLEYALK